MNSNLRCKMDHKNNNVNDDTYKTENILFNLLRYQYIDLKINSNTNRFSIF